jgi:hypothetical protein
VPTERSRRPDPVRLEPSELREDPVDSKGDEAARLGPVPSR